MNVLQQIEYAKKELLAMDEAIKQRAEIIKQTRTGERNLEHGERIGDLIARRQKKSDQLESLMQQI